MFSGNVTSGGFWSDSYHDFAVLWLPDLLAWYIDGEQYFNTTKFVPNTPAYIVLDNEVGLGHKEGPDGGWAGNPSTTVFPQEMKVDRVTVWRRVGGFKTDDAASVINISVGWDEPPLAVSPAINSWHDTPLGASGNPHHDDIYPPTTYDIVDAMNAARSQLRAPYVRLWSSTDYQYFWPNGSSRTIVGPEALPPNNTETCRLHFPNCTCCPRADCACIHKPPGTVPSYAGGGAMIAQTTSWDFRALDIQVASLQSSTAFPETNILQITGNVPPWWFWAPGADHKEFADPTGKSVGKYFSRILDWYSKGGMTDELNTYHHSGHNYTFGYLEVLNEMDYIAGPKYIKWYDGVVTTVRKAHPKIRFIGNCHAGQGTPAMWEQFLNRSEHAADAPFPIDAVSFHGCKTGTSLGIVVSPTNGACRFRRWWATAAG